MGGGGSIAAMRASLKANERKRERNRYFKKGGFFENSERRYKSTEVKKLYAKELSKKEKFRIRKFTKNQRKKEQMLNSVILTLSIFLSFTTLYLLVTILRMYYFKA